MRNICLAALFSLASVAVWGQATSQIQGIVKDPTGAAIAGAEIKATQTATGISRVVPSGADGVYVLPSLAVGPYRLEVGKTGFSTYVQNGIVLQVNTNPTIDVTLNVGDVSTQVQVEANAALVDTQGTSVGTVIENKRILELPLNGRNPVELIQLAGAAVPAGRNGTAGMPGGLNISVAGGLLSGINYTLDGTNYSNPFDAVNLPFPFPDALQEFKVETNSLTAQNGAHGSAAVSAVVKSGTNEFHGNLFEFFRNGKLNARNIFALRRDTLKRNQFGGTLGGPIQKNKLFFFGGFQGTRLRSDPAEGNAFTPTAQYLAGDFNGCNSRMPATLTDPTTGQPFPGRLIPASRLNAQSLNVVKFLPKSNDAACGQVGFGAIQQVNENQYLVRGDYQISDKQMLFGRYFAVKYAQPASFALSGNVLDSTGQGLDNMSQTSALGHTYLISPTSVNTFRLAYNRASVFRFNDDYFSSCDLGVKFHCFVPHQTVVGVTGEFTIGVGTAIEASFVPSYWNLADDYSIVRGSHQIVMGFNGTKYQHSQKANVFAGGTFTFNTLRGGVANSGTGNNMADFLLGRLGQLTQGLPNTVFTTKWQYGLFIQDTWKASRRLTVNAGLRWEPFLPQRLNNGAVYNFLPERFYARQGSTVFPGAPAGLLYGNDPGFEGLRGVKNRFNQFAPRLGLSFDPGADGKTVIRVAGGIAYDFPNAQIMSTPATAPPFGNALTNIPGPHNFSDPWATASATAQNPFPGTPGSFVPLAAYMAQNPNAKGTTIYSWNLSIQRQLGATMAVSATYMGNQTAHVWVTRQLNPAVVAACPGGAAINTCNTTANTNQRRVLFRFDPANNMGGGFAAVDDVESGGTISYNGLLLTLQKRLARGVNLNANYTWSHCIGDITQASSVLGTLGGLNIPDNRAYDRGNCQTPTLDGTQALDRRHIFNMTAVYEIPKFNGRMTNMFASNWRMSGSYRQLSGGYLTVTSGVDQALNGQPGTQRPNLVLGDSASANQNRACPTTVRCIDWLNPAAFAQPAFGTFGNLGRSNVPGPGFFGLDVALSRLFRLTESKTVEARGEAFNLTNSFRASGVTTAINNANFGRIQSAQDPRIMQLAVKFVF